MNIVFVILMIGAGLGVLASLGLGLVTMASGGTLEASRRSNRYMRMRVYFQGAAILLFMLAMAVS